MGDSADFLWCAIVRPPLGFCKNLLTGKCIVVNLMNKGFFNWKMLLFLIRY